jgi:hypothetical protein
LFTKTVRVALTSPQIVMCQARLGSDNPNTTQTLEYTKDKYNAKIRKRRVSPKVPPTTYKG